MELHKIAGHKLGYDREGNIITAQPGINILVKCCIRGSMNITDKKLHKLEFGENLINLIQNCRMSWVDLSNCDIETPVFYPSPTISYKYYNNPIKECVVDTPLHFLSLANCKLEKLTILEDVPKLSIHNNPIKDCGLIGKFAKSFININGTNVKNLHIPKGYDTQILCGKDTILHNLTENNEIILSQ